MRCSASDSARVLSRSSPAAVLQPLKPAHDQVGLVIMPRTMFVHQLSLSSLQTSHQSQQQQNLKHQATSHNSHKTHTTMSAQPEIARSIPSPFTTQIPTLSAEEIAALPYPPDYYPGARDVKTPYGSMRVYEWGPEGGRKVMLVHGDATCAPVWKRVADGLVGRGCRVCVIGRCL